MVLKEAKEIAKDVKVILPNQGDVADCAKYGVVIASAIHGSMKDNYLSEMEGRRKRVGLGIAGVPGGHRPSGVSKRSRRTTCGRFA